MTPLFPQPQYQSISFSQFSMGTSARPQPSSDASHTQKESPTKYRMPRIARTRRQGRNNLDLLQGVFTLKCDNGFFYIIPDYFEEQKSSPPTDLLQSPAVC